MTHPTIHNPHQFNVDTTVVNGEKATLDTYMKQNGFTQLANIDAKITEENGVAEAVEVEKNNETFWLFTSQIASHSNPVEIIPNAAVEHYENQAIKEHNDHLATPTTLSQTANHVNNEAIVVGRTKGSNTATVFRESAVAAIVTEE